MNYRSVDLPIDLAEARRRIAERVDGLVVEEAPDVAEFRTPSGLRLATLTEVTLPDGEPGTRLEYRTAIVSSSAAHARRKAAEIRAAVDRLQRQES